MALPELVKLRAERLLEAYCGIARPRQLADVKLYSIFEGSCIILWLDVAVAGASESDQPLAQLRYHDILSQWTLHYHDDEGRWRLYLNCPPTLDLEKLLEHLDADPLRLFWP